MHTRSGLRAALLIGVLLVGALLVTGCATATDSRAPTNTAATGPDPLLDFSAVAVGGETFDGRQLAGKPAVLWFWAPWCPTCRAQTPAVSRLAETYRNRVNVVGVGGLDQESAIRDFADRVGDQVIVLTDAEGAVWRHFGVTAQSAYVVLDADGQVVVQGYLDDAALAERVADLVD